jgi:hypothetical protein
MSAKLLKQLAANEKRIAELLRIGQYFAGSWPGLSREAEALEREQDSILNILEGRR